ncbi:MAG: hypothetical protein A3H59_03145 [Candidatus Jacksonbacteria bacterium RIFCSPLOWO2_02_FULL_43_9]|nr:MAG: Pentapeptide repeat-containing protein [Parcubacteria group bacterium GW2011_GWA2_43_13]OGY68605.1 MAG: hypothetical protein A3B94_01490 [Candidatus Jacksonbacteria bacterium RIFCSPHIGHO2_02_FULL_43_10]OGY71392.1 MAG: hypothetical protein A2986_01545 [Candidatus Jacksonbacteria bacterium RIFCSPLOWO2_01_FULL_44_13]OGY73065.1 MAG: hypothetical protein A3H59_03145 [Candidatus Jacksonbacteria bacterium RIFCSPLOWO2_02_FULL_43_9]HAZ16526.1 hypothetical protein [Candidatus Jacksonbacteria bact
MTPESHIHNPEQEQEPLSAENVVSRMEQRLEVLHTWVDKNSAQSVDFSGFDFRGRTLQKIYFPGARLCDANFSGMSLHSPEFQDADLKRALFVGAIIEGHDWSRSDLRGANFTHAIFLHIPKMENALFDDDTTFPEGFDDSLLLRVKDGCLFSYDPKNRVWQKNIFENRKLSCMDFAGLDLQGAVFRKSNFGESVVSDADFRKVHSIQGAKFFETRMFGAHFEGVDVSGCDFSSSKYLEGAHFDGARYDDSTLFPQGFVPEEHGMVRK